eukprot:COSAG06_NODE_47671_length_337_cov_1.302521_1_plen_25_part_01
MAVSLNTARAFVALVYMQSKDQTHL